MPDALGRALREASLPDSSERRRDVARLASEGSSRSERRRDKFQSHRGRRLLPIPVAIAAALLLIVLVSLTPPGRAVADTIGRLVGIGDEPTLDQSKGQDLVAEGKAVVVAQGTIPGTSQPYEASAYAANDKAPREQAPDKLNSCLNFDLPGLDSQQQVRFDSVCTDRPMPSALDVDAASDNLGRLGDAARFSAGGLLSDDVADVRVSYEDSAGDRVQVPVVVARLDDSVAKQTGAPVTFGRFEAFFPDDGLPTSVGVFGHDFYGTVKVMALDAQGNKLATADGKRFLHSPDVPTSPDATGPCQGAATYGSGEPACVPYLGEGSG